MDPFLQVFQESLRGVYSHADVELLLEDIAAISKDPVKREQTYSLEPRDAVLVCYADSVVSADGAKSPLASLEQLLVEQGWQGLFPVVHLLPFFPWDTDRGFSVCNFFTVAPENGTWSDIHSLSQHVRLMFDFVANHASIENPLVQSALIERHLDPQSPDYTEYARYKDFVLAFAEDERPSPEELAALSRPRANPVLTPYYVERTLEGVLLAKLGVAANVQGTLLGSGYVWTTFSRGCNDQGIEHTRQVDLNYRNPKVFKEALDIVLHYAKQRASWIRLDAIGYLWKSLGSSSLHEPETHRLVAAMHAALAYCAPELVTIAEVNEPQEKVFTYLGEPSAPEADMVYQFSHFPLAVHALYRGSAETYRQWLSSSEVAHGRQFITVVGSHDGMGMKPLRGILDEDEIETFAEHLVQDRGGLPNYAILPGGRQIVYEVCATAWELVNGQSKEAFSQQLARYRVVVALGLFARGVPALYLQGVIGARNYIPAEGLDENRTVNRERFELAALTESLSQEDSHHAAVLAVVASLLRCRSEYPAICSAQARMRVCEEVDARLVVVHRQSSSQEAILVANVSDSAVPLSLDVFTNCSYREVLSDSRGTATQNGIEAEIPAYGVWWIVPE